MRKSLSKQYFIFELNHSSKSHKDACYAGYGISFYVDRVVDSGNGSDKVYETRRHKEKEEKALWPEDGGGNFVDLTLHIVVKQATGTLMAFKPEFPHGTTRLCGAHNRICAITFSSHILHAYHVAASGDTVQQGNGAGDNFGDIEQTISEAYS